MHGKPRSGAIHHEMLTPKMRYTKAIKDKENQNLLIISNDLHDCLVKKDFQNFWKSWNNKLNIRKNGISVEGLQNDSVIAAEFANYFESVCSVQKTDHANKPRDKFLELFSKYELVHLYDPPCTLDIVVIEKIINEAKCGKAAGVDGLMAEHLKFAHPLILVIIKKLFNIMISIGFVPKAFGLGLIFPIPKGNNNNCNFAKIKDFRGITISPVISKIFEHCLITLSVDILQSSHFQFGFKKDKGCRDALYVLNEAVDYLVDRGSTVNLCAVDLTKAFDNVDHYILFTKLLNKKVPIYLIKILHDWYTKCFCMVNWGKSVSRIFPMAQGVRQGGVLSPILFSIYVDGVLVKLNEIGLGCHLQGMVISAIMYADDIILLSPSVRLLQQIAALCEQEFNEINLKFNVLKCTAMRIGVRHKCDAIELYDLFNNSIQWVNEMKYLGVVLKHGMNLKINVHQNKVKYFRAFNAIFAKLGSSSNPDTLVHLIKSHCLSVLLYNLEAVHLSKSNLNDLCFPLNRSYVKIFHVNDKINIAYCQFYMQQLPVELQLDFRRMCYLRKLACTNCSLLTHIFECCSKANLEYLYEKYDIVSVDNNISRNALLRCCWSKFASFFNIE